MTKILFSRVSVIATCILLCVGSLFAQEDKKEWTWSAGFTLSPQIIYTFDEKPPRQVGASLLGITSLYNDDWYLAGFYNFASNEPVVLASYTISPKVGMYYFGSLKTNSDIRYSGLGVTTPLGKALGFLEVGRNFGSDAESHKLFMLTGLLIPFHKVLN